MRYFDVLAYEDEAGNPVELSRPEREALSADDYPMDLDNVYGMWVHVWDDNDDEYHKYFWIYEIASKDDWDDWWDFIEGYMARHGMAA